MADVKWIKIVTDIFDDEKILLIETLPEADSMIVIWFKLLCLAGKQNNKGVFLLNDKIPYTEKMLATIFRRKESTVQLALQTFEQFGMIEIVDGVITIPKWSKHQNFDKIDKNNEYMKNYMREYRAKQKLLAQGNSVDNEEENKEENEDVKVNVNINSKSNGKVNGKSNVSGLDKNREDKNREDKEKNINNTIDDELTSNSSSSSKKTSKHKYGNYKNVLLTDEEHQKLLTQYGPINLETIIKYLDEYIEMKGTKYKSHYLVILKWGAEAALKNSGKETRNYFKEFLES